MAHHQNAGSFRALLREAAEAGIRPEVTSFPLEEANEALARLREGNLRGSAVLLL